LLSNGLATAAFRSRNRHNPRSCLAPVAASRVQTASWARPDGATGARAVAVRVPFSEE